MWSNCNSIVPNIEQLLFSSLFVPLMATCWTEIRQAVFEEVTKHLLLSLWKRPKLRRKMTQCEYGNQHCCNRSKANAMLNQQRSEHNGDHGLSDFCKIEYLSQRTCQILLDASARLSQRYPQQHYSAGDSQCTLTTYWWNGMKISG